MIRAKVVNIVAREDSITRIVGSGVEEVTQNQSLKIENYGCMFVFETTWRIGTSRRGKTDSHQISLIDTFFVCGGVDGHTERTMTATGATVDLRVYTKHKCLMVYEARRGVTRVESQIPDETVKGSRKGTSVHGVATYSWCRVQSATLECYLQQFVLACNHADPNGVMNAMTDRNRASSELPVFGSLPKQFCKI